ncbi:hypothetical protein Tbis_0280 [Thermobispora bispora DSM 43833]|jgi:hypothetical protein|uniref:Uncharacterized protein n=1 Tax=Thermobispora bispora (strain ATCC 19993 / DSM 43833 / CBS 139.67 / JCM 10125 / KCTC 9307 / NBRC 14880 / R51) TaxID=469371 RepID=D6Y3I2_THEBD|nr:hypothetical protein Tbis_0280 [Thermobispora bispora DSM 43833]
MTEANCNPYATVKAAAEPGAIVNVRFHRVCEDM